MDHCDAIHHYSEHHSPIHNLDARVKIIVALSFILLLVTTPPTHLLSFTIFAGLLLWSIGASHIPLRFILKRSAIILPFSALIAIGLPFMQGGETVMFFDIELSRAGLWLFFGATIKAFLSVAGLVLLITTTRFDHLMHNLRALGIPALFIDMLALTYRYIFVLTEEASRMRRAAVARGYKPKYLPQSIIVGRMIGALFLRSYERAERIYDAMVLRGYQGQLPNAEIAPLSATDKCLTLSSLLLLSIIRVVTS